MKANKVRPRTPDFYEGKGGRLCPHAKIMRKLLFYSISISSPLFEQCLIGIMVGVPEHPNLSHSDVRGRSLERGPGPHNAEKQQARKKHTMTSPPGMAIHSGSSILMPSSWLG